MNKITTYIKVNDDFILIGNFSGPLPDQFYIEGAVVFVANGKTLIDQRHWDYVDQLWFILVDGIDHIMHSKHYMGYFPDQPVEVIFKNVNDIYAEVRIGSKGAVIEKKVLIPLVLSAGIEFFRHLNLLMDKKGEYDEVISKLEKMIKKM